ncbi:MAG: glycosyltransferase family 39 protein [Chthoniobacter sp.]|uniref:ArnT family glycosyltransferase n=1 Tax=Chthoniobacter sp. TaxID=2510640 RepID=UPI0032AA4770
MTLAPHSRIWWLGLLVALGALGWSFASDFTAPWTDQLDGNGACWSQSAHNTLAAGLVSTAGVPSAFYFGTPPIPPDGFYTHHPPLLSLMLTAMFALFGEAEWVARLLPVVFSFLGVVLLWLLVKDCTNARAAAFAVIAFAALPMELRYGRMVNFEPVNLVWMLGALLALRHWEKTGEGGWWWVFLTVAVLAVWTAWLGYLFVLVVSFHPRLSVRRRGWLFVAMAVSLATFALQIRLVRPDAWHDLFAAMNHRMAHGASSISWRDWSARIGSLLLAHIQAALWLLGLTGAVIVRRSSRESPLRWLGGSAACFFVMSALYIVLFRNASSIHDYASFYFTVPVAMMAAVALDALCHWCGTRSALVRVGSVAGVLALLGFLVCAGERQTMLLRRPFLILTDENPEPPDLIPELGHAMRTWFGQDVAVICNLLPSYGPQLPYYARHELLPAVFTADEWVEVIADPENTPVGGAIWLGDPRAEQIVAKLPPGPQERLTIRGIPFCFWRPAEEENTVSAH